MRQLLFYILISLSVLLSSCAVNKYDYYYSIIKNADKNGNARQVPLHNDIFYMSTKPDTSQVDFVSFYVHLNGSFIDFYIENAIPVYIDYPKTKIIVNDTVYRLNASGVDEYGIKYYEPVEKRPDVPYEQDLFGSIQLPDDFFYDLYKRYKDGEYQKVDYSINNEHIDISTIRFSEENTPVSVRAEIVYYTDSACVAMNMAEVNLYQSDLLKMKDVREEKYSQKIYRLGTDIAADVPDVSFYTRVKTGKIRGWPEVQVKLIEIGTVALAVTATVLYVVVEASLESDDE